MCTIRPSHLLKEVKIETEHVTQGQGWEAPAPHTAATEVAAGEEGGLHAARGP